MSGADGNLDGNGIAIRKFGLSRTLARRLREAPHELQSGTSHRFRHTFATRLLRSGTDLATLRDLLGRSDIGVTSKYLGAFPQRAEAVAALASLLGPAGSPDERRGQLH